MNESKPTPPPITPYLTVDDARAAIAFYEKAFGAKTLHQQATPDGTKLIHAALLLDNGGLVMLSDDFPAHNGGKSITPKALGGSGVTIHLDLKDVDAAWKKAVEAGATVAMPLADQFWGDRYGMVIDPFGHRWSLATSKAKPPQADVEAGVAKHFTKKD